MFERGREIVCRHGDGSIATLPVRNGESVLIVQNDDSGEAHNHHDWKRLIKEKLGVDSPDMTCALVNNDNVVEQIIMADPDIDESPSPNHRMIFCYSRQITVGCTYDPATGLFWTTPGQLPAHTVGNDGDTPVEVPSAIIPKP